MKPFAPVPACGEDWHRLFFETDMVWGVLDGGGHDPQASAIRDLLWFRRAESGMKASQGAFDIDPDLTGLSRPDPEGNVALDCGGHHTLVTAYDVRSHRRDPTPTECKVQDCWLLTSAGELRHLIRTNTH